MFSISQRYLGTPFRSISTVKRLMSSATPTSEVGPIETSIRNKLTDLLKPTELKISNDSWQHRHHAPMKAIGGGDGETHFSVEVVSDEFTGKRTMQRHRMIYGALDEEFKAGLHALSLNTKTPSEIASAATAS
ncbi:hypothetical protein M407DRAFT_243987 [Tulasnella calospora MUT 4182]|uniref:BolA protein n=1 Tax=Tulasnella calospora MUT 4182 TaxID=1051891 RepID=A0A0C3Q7R1_9AGAM|nr:hypothetical protein M407DRAFT_243987 [Tulasnella calospora MUT 4182]